MIISFFRRSKLWAIEENSWLRILREKVSPEIQNVEIERRFLVDSARELTKDELTSSNGSSKKLSSRNHLMKSPC